MCVCVCGEVGWGDGSAQEDSYGSKTSGQCGTHPLGGCSLLRSLLWGGDGAGRKWVAESGE